MLLVCSLQNMRGGVKVLFWMYFTGTGVDLDFSEAAKWVRRASELGYARAQLDLGYLYEQGKGVPMDHVAAYMWYKAAADRGEHRAAAALKSPSPLMTDARIKHAGLRVAPESPRASFGLPEICSFHAGLVDQEDLTSGFH